MFTLTAIAINSVEVIRVAVMTFLCDICEREFTEKRSLTRHMKNQHGNLWSCHRCNQWFHRCDNYEMHQRTCLCKTTGMQSGKHRGEDITRKKLKDNVNCVSGALSSTLLDYRLDIEGDQQDASSVLNVLKESPFKMKNNSCQEESYKLLLILTC